MATAGAFRVTTGGVFRLDCPTWTEKPTTPFSWVVGFQTILGLPAQPFPSGPRPSHSRPCGGKGRIGNRWNLIGGVSNIDQRCRNFKFHTGSNTAPPSAFIGDWECCTLPPNRGKASCHQSNQSHNSLALKSESWPVLNAVSRWGLPASNRLLGVSTSARSNALSAIRSNALRSRSSSPITHGKEDWPRLYRPRIDGARHRIGRSELPGRRNHRGRARERARRHCQQRERRWRTTLRLCRMLVNRWSRRAAR